MSGQFVMDFAPGERVVPANVKSMHVAETAAEFFVRGVALEDDLTSASLNVTQIAVQFTMLPLCP